jgi:hypothetical protein
VRAERVYLCIHQSPRELGQTKTICPLPVLVSLWRRREEKQYVEGMEDEDMKKETQNLAYPPAFKLEVALFAKKHSQASHAAQSKPNLRQRRKHGTRRSKDVQAFAVVENGLIPTHLRANTGKASSCYS